MTSAAAPLPPGPSAPARKPPTTAVDAVRPVVGRWVWIYRPATDLLLACCWIPIFFGAHLLSTGSGAANDDLLRSVVTWTLIGSLLHQPITLLLVYGDHSQFALRRTLFTWAPVIAAATVAGAVGLDLWLVVPVAAIWNTLHTVQQRYGICRIYARKTGYGSARLDRLVLFSSIATVIVLAGARASTATQLDRVSLGSANADAVRTLTSIRPYATWLLVPVALVAAGSLLALVVQEWRFRAQASRGRWIYLGTTLTLIAGIGVDPLAGLVAWVFAHTVEYVVIVQRTMAKRYPTPARTSLLSALGAGSRRWWLLAGFLTAVLLLDVRGQAHGDAYLVVIYTLGVLHFTYDAVIWKTRKPDVAADFGIRPQRGLSGER
jgi:hypothetical protein